MTNIKLKRQKKHLALSTIALAVFLTPGCAPQLQHANAETVLTPPANYTLTGQPIRPPEFSDQTRKRLNTDLAIAQAAFDVAPEREDSYIWLGRRLGYLGRNEEAISIFTKGLEAFPQSYKLHRFRGRHRARNRDFSGAIADYEAGIKNMSGIADSFEPDGMPNSIGLTISTFRSNLHYYLGQTSFAVGDYQKMFDELQTSLNSPIALPIEDHKVAVVFWQYIALMKLGRKAEAQAHLQTIPQEIKLIENHSYHKAVMVLQNNIADDDVMSEGDSLSKFALGMSHIFDGKTKLGEQVLVSIVVDNPLGYWPAEAELMRLNP